MPWPSSSTFGPSFHYAPRAPTWIHSRPFKGLFARYYGVTRLRWRDTVLYLVPTSSPLSSGTLREELLSPEEDATTESILPPMPSRDP